MNETKLRAILKTRELRQNKFARRIGVSPQVMNFHVKHGIRSVRIARRYAEALNCRPEELIEF